MKKILASLLMISMIVVTTSCTAHKPEIQMQPPTDKISAIPKEELKVGFIYNNALNRDNSFTQAHDQGRLELEKMGIKTVYADSVPLSINESSDIIRGLITEEGCNVIYVTSMSYEQSAIEVANEFPEVYFAQCGGDQISDNMSTYFGRMYQVKYLSGIVAGKKTKTNKIGYIAAKPVKEVIRGINAFALGVRSVNPDATVEVSFTDNWFSPTLERQYALKLLGRDVDVIAQHQDTTAAQIAAQEKGAFVIGQYCSTFDIVPDAYLTGCLFDWSVFYKDDIQKIIDGTWAPRKYWDGIESGVVKLDELSDLCAEGTGDAVKDAKLGLESGELNIFQGPIKDQKGIVKIKADEKLADDQIWNMDWFVEGVSIVD